MDNSCYASKGMKDSPSAQMYIRIDQYKLLHNISSLELNIKTKYSELSPS